MKRVKNTFNLNISSVMSILLLIGEPGSGKCRMIKSIINDFDKILWITTTSSAEFVRRSVGSDPWIIDVFSWIRRKTHTEKDIVVTNPINLNEVSLAIGKALEELRSDYLLILNSISGLLIYHTPQKILHFIRNLIVRIENENASGIFTIVKDAHDKSVENSVAMMFPSIALLESGGVRFIKSIVPIETNFLDFDRAREIVLKILKTKYI